MAANELPTDGYTTVNAALSYRIRMQGVNPETFLRGVNLLNEEARNHVSFSRTSRRSAGAACSWANVDGSKRPRGMTAAEACGNGLARLL